MKIISSRAVSMILPMSLAVLMPHPDTKMSLWRGQKLGVTQLTARRAAADLCAASLSGKVITRAEALGAQDWSCKPGLKATLGYGVIGNTTVSGTVILGSSPGIPAQKYRRCSAGFLEFQNELPI